MLAKAKNEWNVGHEEWKHPFKLCPNCGKPLYNVKNTQPAFFICWYACKECGFKQYIEKVWRY